MKFTRQQAYENIVAKLTAHGEKLDLSERSINEQLDTLMKVGANEETELEDFAKNFLPLFVTANANVRNDVSQGINKYKEEHPAQNPAQPNGSGSGNGQQQTKDSSDLEQRLAEMERKIAERDKETKISSLKNELKNSLKSKGVKSEKWIDTILTQVSIDEECDVSEKTESLLGLYNEFVASVDPSVVPLGAPGNGGGNRNSVKNAVEEAAKLAKSMSYN